MFTYRRPGASEHQQARGCPIFARLLRKGGTPRTPFPRAFPLQHCHRERSRRTSCSPSTSKPEGAPSLRVRCAKVGHHERRSREPSHSNIVIVSAVERPRAPRVPASPRVPHLCASVAQRWDTTNRRSRWPSHSNIVIVSAVEGPRAPRAPASPRVPHLCASVAQRWDTTNAVPEGLPTPTLSS